MGIQNVLRPLYQVYIRVSTFLHTGGLLGVCPPQGCTGSYHSVQEAMLLGFCLQRFGAAETLLYDTIMARIERRQHTALPRE